MLKSIIQEDHVRVSLREKLLPRLDSISAEPELHPPIALLKNVVYAMSPQAVTDVWVRGRRVVEGQRLATLDQDRLLERVRALTRGWTRA
jgi:hypothetical protein